MGYLFVFSTSPFKRKEMETFLRLSKRGDSCLFIQNGVFAARGLKEPLSSLIQEKLEEGVFFYFLKEDLEARGIEPTWGEVLDYDGFLDLVERMEKVIH